jgi:hypothetical protein
MVGAPSAKGEHEMACYAEALERRLMMKRIATTLILLFMIASSVTYGQVASESTTSQGPSVQSSQTIKITRSGSQHPNKGFAEYFTGSVQVQPFFLRSIRRAQAAEK